MSSSNHRGAKKDKNTDLQISVLDIICHILNFSSTLVYISSYKS